MVNDNAKVKLADFGIAARFQPGKLMKEQVGTPAFMAPEIHMLPKKSPGYDEKVDLWAVGVVMVRLPSSCLYLKGQCLMLSVWVRD